MKGRPTNTPHTAFRTEVEALAIDLTLPPLDRDRSIWTDPAAYGPCQDLADAARGAGVEAIVYESVRDPERRRNLAVLRPEALGRGRPVTAQQTWWIHMTAAIVTCVCEFPPPGPSYRREDFANPHGRTAWRGK